MRRTVQSAIEAIARQEQLDAPATAVQETVADAYAAGGPAAHKLKNLLHGVGIGHPLHAMLTDIPVGAWTAALALDALEVTTGREDLRAGADTAMAVGLAGALGAALAGLTDWHVLGEKRPRRLGFVHAVINVTATSLYGMALLLRRLGARRAGLALSLMGYGALSCGAYLGGVLVYEQKIGVEHEAETSPPRSFMPVLAEAALGDGELRRADARGFTVLLARRGQRVYALADTCSHLGCSLAKGRLEGDSVVCTCHGSRFALQDGSVLDGPAVYPQSTLETRIHNGQIEVRASA